MSVDAEYTSHAGREHEVAGIREANAIGRRWRNQPI